MFLVMQASICSAYLSPRQSMNPNNQKCFSTEQLMNNLKMNCVNRKYENAEDVLSPTNKYFPPKQKHEKYIK